MIDRFTVQRRSLRLMIAIAGARAQYRRKTCRNKLMTMLAIERNSKPGVISTQMSILLYIQSEQIQDPSSIKHTLEIGRSGGIC